MKRLYLMRHGEAELEPGGREGQLFSVGDWPLSRRGRQQAEAARDALAQAAFDSIAASPLKRSLETARIVASVHRVPVRIDPGFAELPLGSADQRTYDEVVASIRAVGRALAEGRDECFPGGRTFSGERRRILAALDRTLDGHERVLVVAHGGVNRVILAQALGMPPANIFRLEQGHACINQVEYAPERTRVRRVNVTPLDPL